MDPLSRRESTHHDERDAALREPIRHYPTGHCAQIKRKELVVLRRLAPIQSSRLRRDGALVHPLHLQCAEEP